MKTEQVLKAAVANRNLTDIKVYSTKTKPKYFDLYHVGLPLPDFSGFPPTWLFIVHNSVASQHDRVPRDTLLKDVYKLLDSIPGEERVLLVSDDPTARLGEEFDALKRDVFCLDALNFIEHEDKFVQPRLSPFIRSVRHKLHQDRINSMLYSPYEPVHPVQGWQFFGRQKQIDQIIGSDSNFVIIGARRVGKTSLMREAHRRLLERGEQTYFIDVQNLSSAGEVIREILLKISPRDLARLVRQQDILGEDIFSGVLRRITSGNKRVTIFIDEMGLVLRNTAPENWKFLGVLRKFSQAGRLRFIISGFQEFVFRQQQEFSGPLINFANTIRLRVFTRKDVEDFVLAPLRFWSNLHDREERALIEVIMSRVGSHPFLLQFFCFQFFESLAKTTDLDGNVGRRVELAQQANNLFHTNIIEWFRSAVDEIFFRIPSPMLQYLFLRRCVDAEKANQRVDVVEFDYEWLSHALEEIGLEGTFQSYRTILESLEMHSLCTAFNEMEGRMSNAAPVVYYYVKRAIPSMEVMLKKLSEDTRKEVNIYGLTPITKPGNAS